MVDSNLLSGFGAQRERQRETETEAERNKGMERGTHDSKQEGGSWRERI